MDMNADVAEIAGNGYVKGSIEGISTSTSVEKMWLVSQAIGDIAFAYPYSLILIEIQVWCVILDEFIHMN